MNKKIRINKDNIVGQGQPCFLIAEVGVNHNGDLEIAKKMIDIAVKSGVDAVKFQTFKTEELILSNIEKAPYQKNTTDAKESQKKMLKKLEIDEEFHYSLINYCKEKNICFLSTPFDEVSLELLIKLKVPAIKIASTDTTNLLFLEKVAKSKLPIILSTGMSSIYEIEKAYSCLKENGCNELVILKCTSNYPTDISEVNLLAMKTIEKNLGTLIGFSDHTEGVGASPYAVAMGAKVVEKHFTLDKNMEGPDHKASLSPDELEEWVTEIRKVEKMLGIKDVIPTESEQKTKIFLQKNIVSKKNILKGEYLTRDNISAKRTGGNGISAIEFYDILDKKTKNDIDIDNPVKWTDLET